MRRHEIDVQRLLKAGERLRTTQLEVAGDPEPDAFVDARVEERSAVDGLVRAAATILESTGHAGSDATLNRIRTNLRTAAVTEDGRELLKRGRLVEDLGAAGFEAFAGMALPSPPARKAKAARAPEAGERRLAAARAKLEKAQVEAAGLADEATGAEHALDVAREELERAEREAKRLRARADRAAERGEKLERELERIP